MTVDTPLSLAAAALQVPGAPDRSVWARSDFISPPLYADPATLHARLQEHRRHCPIAWVDQAPYRPFWAITRHADIIEVERQHTLFINAPRVTLVPQEVELQTVAAMGQRTAMVRSILDMDEPDHRKYRAVAQSWFLGPGVARFQARIEAVCQQWIDRMQAMDGACDFAADIANYVPLSVIMTILGLPEADMPFVLRSTQQLFGASDPDMQDASGDHGRTVFMELMGYLGEVVAQRRRTPTDDLASVIANGVVDGAPMAMLETLSYLLITSTAGHETTASALAGGLLALLEHPQAMAQVRADPSLWERTATDEVLRWVTPVRHMMRTATQDTTLGGQTIRAGDGLALLYWSANRDEAVFTDPFRFDVLRSEGRHLAFGSGVHFCVGRMLALTEIRTFFQQLLARTRHIELAGPAVPAQSNFVGTLKSLPVRYSWRS